MQTWSFVLLMKFSNKLKLCAPNPARTQSPKTLARIAGQTNDMKFALKILLLLTLLTGCGDKINIKVTGQITDEATGEPINNADISASCWYHHDIDDASLDRKSAKTDNSGKFEVDFEKGYAVNLVVKAKNYEAKQISKDLNETEISFSIKLRKAKANPTLISFTDKSSLSIEDSEKDPYLRVRFQGLKSRQLDFNNAKTYGFDFSSQTTKTETLNWGAQGARARAARAGKSPDWPPRRRT